MARVASVLGLQTVVDNAGINKEHHCSLNYVYITSVWFKGRDSDSRGTG